MAAPRRDQFDTEIEHQTNEDMQANHKSSKHLLYSEKYSENLLSDKLNVLTAKGRSPKFEKPQIFRVPNSSVLGQVKNFLPQMEAANQSLNELAKTVPSDELDIENIDGCSGPVIEMNLALVETTDCCSDEDFTDSSTDSDSEDSDNTQCQQMCSVVTEDTMKLSPNLPKRKPYIVELGEDISKTIDTQDVIQR